MSKIFLRLSVFDLVLIAVMAALGIAVKPIIVPLVHLITGPLLIPGGSVAGGIYMLWIVLGSFLIKNPFTGTLISMVEAIIVIATGVQGSHGIMSLITYILPGLAVDFCRFLCKKNADIKMQMFLCGIFANVAGTLLSNYLFFRLPAVPLILSLSAGALSGGLGGIIAYSIYKRLYKLGIFRLDKVLQN